MDKKFNSICGLVYVIDGMYRERRFNQNDIAFELCMSVGDVRRATDTLGYHYGKRTDDKKALFFEEDFLFLGRYVTE